MGVEKEFPNSAKDGGIRPQFVQLLNDADEDHNGDFDFLDFLRLMRLIRDLQEQFRIQKELTAVDQTRFSGQEVEEFRELFEVAGGENTQEINYEQLKDLVQRIAVLSPKTSDQLRAIFTEMAAQQDSTDGTADMLDFPEFLLLMRQLVDVNFA